MLCTLCGVVFIISYCVVLYFMLSVLCVIVLYRMILYRIVLHCNSNPLYRRPILLFSYKNPCAGSLTYDPCHNEFHHKGHIC